VASGYPCTGQILLFLHIVPARTLLRCFSHSPFNCPGFRPPEGRFAAAESLFGSERVIPYFSVTVSLVFRAYALQAGPLKLPLLSHGETALL